MDQTINQLVAERNWEGLKYTYTEADEETRLEFAYPFGKAFLIEGGFAAPVNTLVQGAVAAFRISLYDKRLVNDMLELYPDHRYEMLTEMDKQAWNYTRKATDHNQHGAANSRRGFEYYLLAYFLHPEPTMARKCFTKAKAFLVETHLAQLINSVCKHKCTWNALLNLTSELMPLDDHFIQGLLILLRLYNANDFQRKTAQQGFIAFLTEQKDIFTESDNKILSEFHTELQTEFLQFFIDLMTKQEVFKKRMMNDLVTRADNLKQFAIQHAHCPEDLDNSFFRETLVHKKATDLLERSKKREAFGVIVQEYNSGLPPRTILVRDLLTTLALQLFEQTHDMVYVVQALKIDPGNDRLKRIFLE